MGARLPERELYVVGNGENQEGDDSKEVKASQYVPVVIILLERVSFVAREP